MRKDINDTIGKKDAARKERDDEVRGKRASKVQELLKILHYIQGKDYINLLSDIKLLCSDL
jgi:hypothetical protein